MGDILNQSDDYQPILDLLGVETRDLSTTGFDAFVEEAERIIIDTLAKQTTVPSIETLLSDVTDSVRLRGATRFKVASLYTIAATNAVDVSITTNKQTKDRGGIGAQWKDQGEEYLKQCDLMLGNLTGFKRWRTL